MKSGDLLYSINDTEVKASNFNSVNRSFNKSTKPGDIVSIVVLRKNDEGTLIKKTLKAKTHLVKITDNYVILPADSPTEEQLMIRKAWINQ